MIITGKDKKHADWDDLTRFEALYIIAAVLLAKNHGYVEITADEAFEARQKMIQLAIVPEQERLRGALVSGCISGYDTRRSKCKVGKLNSV
jgi:hypothetical protein